ncbi:MAG: long-chain fatty acid--CoA ligase [Candidatus Omnitrophica bacterium]|nr:long-chain fatty acid--CoA ligase [Candidatus Omnitrophota bacterium]
MFIWRANCSPNKPALWFKKEGRFQFFTWKEFQDRVQGVTLALYQLGVRRGDRVGILSENRPEWAFADLGILSLGAASVPIYPTSSRKDCHYVLEHAEVSVLFVSTVDQFEKIKPLVQEGKLKTVIGFDLREIQSPHVWTFTDCLEKGRLGNLNNSDLYDQLVQKVTRDDLATLIYTSGTTGPPKGVMLTHGNFLSNCEASSGVLLFPENERTLSFLPLSHVFERMAGYYFMIQQGASIAYAENMQTVAQDLLLVRPTVAASVPRFFEKMHAHIVDTVQKSSPLKQAIFHWSIEVGRKAGEKRATKKPLPPLLKLQFLLAKALVFNKLKRSLGGRIRFFISGGAPLAKELGEFFYAADVLILEGYGLTETSPVISVNRPDHFKFGTVGPPLPGVEVRIAEDGEVLTKGPLIMKGYFKNEEATREVIRDGWFYTGDLGEIDSDGFLKITGRKKDIIVTAGGKNISPQNIENEILGDSLFSQVVIIGDRKPYLVALVVPNRHELERLSKEEGIQSSSWEDLLRKNRIHEIVAQRLRERTKEFAHYEQIQYFHLLPKELTQDAGELTPTLKVKRRVVMERYASIIEALYQSQPK